MALIRNPELLSFVPPVRVSVPSASCCVCESGLSLLINADDVVGLEFVRDCAVANACDHCRHRVAKLHEVLGADRVIETLAKGNFTEFDAAECSIRRHVESMEM